MGKRSSRDRLAFLKKYAPNEPLDNPVAYVNAQTLEYVLRNAGSDLTRANLIRLATSLKGMKSPLLLPGISLSNSPTNYNSFHAFQLSRFDGQRWVKIEMVNTDQ
jgi:hypothetical protein